MRVFYNGKDDSDEYIRRPLFVVNTLVTFWSIDLDLVIYNIFTLKTLSREELVYSRASDNSNC